MHDKAPRLVLLNEVKNLFIIPRCTWNNKLFVYFLDLFIYSTEQVFTIFIGVSRKKWAFRYSKIEKCGIMII